MFSRIVRRSLCLALLGTVFSSSTTAQAGVPVKSSARKAALASFGIATSYTGHPVYSLQNPPTVIDSVQVQGVYLGSAFAGANSGDVAEFDAYLSYIVGSSFMTMLDPYGVGTGTATPGKVLDVSLPQYRFLNYLSDGHIQKYLTANFANGTLMPPTSKTVHVVYVEPGVAVSLDFFTTSINAFLGYHNQGSYVDSQGHVQNFAYAVMPYPGGPNPTPASQGFANAFDELTSVTSHEIAEACTDPGIGSGYLETVTETFTLELFGLEIPLFSLPLFGEEIGDVPLLLLDFDPTCYSVLNGYVVQNMIAPDGVSLLIPAGATTFMPP